MSVEGWGRGVEMSTSRYEGSAGGTNEQGGDECAWGDGGYE